MSNTEAVDVATPPFLEEVIERLDRSPPQLPPKLFYDAEGSRLFEEITELEEYYPTRTEQAILENNIEAIADAVGTDAALIEFGAGSSGKTRVLLRGIPSLAAYVPIDISGEHLEQSVNRLRNEFDGLTVLPLVADYSDDIRLPELPKTTRRNVVFFPGSTIGNFTPDEAVHCLRQMAQVADRDGALIVGIDLVKDERVLLRAYDDPSGVTASFNLNLLARLNREVEADFNLDNWKHRAEWNEEKSRIEMHLVSTTDQRLTIANRSWHFESGAYIHTENSHKFTLETWSALVRRADLQIRNVWMDRKSWFAVTHLRRQ